MKKNLNPLFESSIDVYIPGRFAGHPVKIRCDKKDLKDPFFSKLVKTDLGKNKVVLQITMKTMRDCLVEDNIQPTLENAVSNIKSMEMFLSNNGEKVFVTLFHNLSSDILPEFQVYRNGRVVG